MCSILKPMVNSNWSYNLEKHDLGQNHRFLLPMWPWNLKDGLEKQWGTSFISLQALCIWMQTGVIVWKYLNWGKLFWPLWPWPLILTFCIGITSVNGNYSWKFHDATMRGILWKGVTDGQMDWWIDGRTGRRTDRTILKDAWSQVKTIGHLFYATSSIHLCYFIVIGKFKLELQSGQFRVMIANFCLPCVTFKFDGWPWKRIKQLFRL